MERERINFNRGQVGIEYMLIVGFVTFAILSVLVIAVFYSDKIKDRVKVNQIEAFATQLLNSAESVFFAGEPSKSTVNLYLPSGVNDIDIISNSLVINFSTSSPIDDLRVFESRVPIQGTITSGEGIKKLTLEATPTYLSIS